MTQKDSGARESRSARRSRTPSGPRRTQAGATRSARAFTRRVRWSRSSPRGCARSGITPSRAGASLRPWGRCTRASSVRLGPPVPDPPKIICLGLNYRDHAEEAGLTPPVEPMFFAKWANSLVGPTEPIVPPAIADQVDYEAELAVVIGSPGRNIDAAHALEHVAGAMALNDVSARDLQLANQLWTGGKAIDTFGPCGPALVLRDDIGDLQALAVRTRVNGETVQDGNTPSMIFPVAETIAFLSQIRPLEPGDIIATGTPAGVGNSRDPSSSCSPAMSSRSRSRASARCAIPSPTRPDDAAVETRRDTHGHRDGADPDPPPHQPEDDPPAGDDRLVRPGRRPEAHAPVRRWCLAHERRGQPPRRSADAPKHH